LRDMEDARHGQPFVTEATLWKSRLRALGEKLEVYAEEIDTDAPFGSDLKSALIVASSRIASFADRIEGAANPSVALVRSSSSLSNLSKREVEKTPSSESPHFAKLLK